MRSRIGMGLVVLAALRGINHAHAWDPSQTSSFANIKAAGANTIRVVLSTSFGFLASWNGTNNAPTVSCTRTP